MKVSGILLCAGASIRMGRAKLLLPWGKSTIIGYLIKEYLESNLTEVVVVVGAYREMVVEELKKNKSKKLKIAENDRYMLGMLSSLQEGIKLTEAEAYLVGLGDMPFITREIVNEVISLHKRGMITIPTYKGKAGKPVIFPESLKPAILREEATGKNPRDIIKKHPYIVQKVSIPYKAITIDIDTMEEYNKLKIGGQ